MATISEIRLDNLKLILNEADIRQAELCRRCDIPPSYLTQIIKRTKSHRGRPRGMGDDMARKIERGMGKPEGWMDERHEPFTVNEGAPEYSARQDYDDEDRELVKLARESGLTRVFIDLARRHIEEVLAARSRANGPPRSKD